MNVYFRLEAMIDKAKILQRKMMNHGIILKQQGHITDSYGHKKTHQV